MRYAGTSTQQRVTWLLIMAMAAAALIPVLVEPITVQAQDNCPARLTAADCTILNASNTAMGEVGSFHISLYTLSLNVSTAEGAVAFAAQGSGQVEELNGDPIIALTFDPVTTTRNGQMEQTTGEFRAVDGGLYLGVEENGELTWVGAAAEATSLDDISALFGNGLLNGLPGADMNLEALTTWSRDENVMVDGQEMAVFYADISLAGFLNSSLVTAALTTVVLQAAGEELGPTATALIVSTLLQQLSRQVSENSTFRITRYIALQNHLVMYLALDLAFTLDFSFARGLTPEVDAALPEGDLAFSLDFAATLDQHNADFEIVPPAVYEDITGELEGLFSGIAGSGELTPNWGTNIFPGSGSETSGISLENAEFDVVIGSEAAGTLNDVNTRDVYRLQASRGDYIQIAVRAASPGSLLDPKVELYDANGRLLDSNDDAADAPTAFNLGPLDSYLGFEAPADGVYLIVVRAVFTIDTDEEYILIVLSE